MAVKAVLSGKKQVEVAKTFGVFRNTLGRWMKAYRSGGVPALQAKPRNRSELVHSAGWAWVRGEGFD